MTTVRARAVGEYLYEGVDAAVALHAQGPGGPLQIGFDLTGDVVVGVLVGGPSRAWGEILSLAGQEFLLQAQDLAAGQRLAGLEDLVA